MIELHTRSMICALAAALGLAACSPGGGISLPGMSKVPEGPFAPGVNYGKSGANKLDVAHRLMAAGEYELAIKSFNRAALDQGMDSEVLSGLGSANLGLGRLGQAEFLLRRATRHDGTQPETWNNLGVVLMEMGKTPEAVQIFRKAYAMDNGQSDAIRDNLRLALAKSENSVNNDVDNDKYKLMRRGTGDYLIQSAL